MAKIQKITTAEISAIITETYEDEAAATEGTEPNKTDVKLTQIKVENTKWKKGGLADE